MENDVKKIDEFLLEKDGKPITLQGKCFRAGRIYLGDICAAVRLDPIYGNNSGKSWEIEKARNELYSMLRWFYYLLMDEDLVRPVAALAVEKDFENFGSALCEAVKKWGGDQDWHRGSFTFFLEKDAKDVEGRISDLLLPESVKPRQTKNPRDKRSVLKAIERAEAGYDGQPIRDWFEILRRSVERAYGDAKDKDKSAKVTKDIEKKITEIINHVEKETEEWNI